MRSAAINLPRQRAVKNVVDQSRFAASGHARDYGEQTERNLHVDHLEIVMPRAHYRDFLVPWGAANIWGRNLFHAGEILSRERIMVTRDLSGIAGGYHVP